MNRLKLRQKAKTLFILVLSLALLAGLIFTAVRTILPNGSGQLAKAAGKNFELNAPSTTNDITTHGWSDSSHQPTTSGYAPTSPLAESGTGVAGTHTTTLSHRTAQWSDLNPVGDKASDLRHTSRINALFNGTSSNVGAYYNNEEASGGNQLDSDGKYNSSLKNILKIDANGKSGEYQMVWWIDIELPNIACCFDFDISISLASVKINSSGANSNARYNFFAIAYADGTPGYINGNGGDLNKSKESNKFVFMTDDNEYTTTNGSSYGGPAVFDIPTLSNVEFENTKFLRVGIYLSGWNRWQHCPVITKFIATEKNAGTANFSLNASTSSTSGTASNYVPSSSFGENGTNAVGQWWKTVSWDTLYAQRDKAQYLRNGIRINGLYNGGQPDKFQNDSMRDTQLDATGKTNDSQTYNNGYERILKLGDDVTNAEIIWWTDIVIPDNASGSYNFDISMYSPMSAKSGAQYHFFAIAYSDGMAGRLGGNGQLVQLAQANKYVYCSGTTNSSSYNIPQLTGINLAKTKFIRVGAYLRGGVDWQHCPVITKFDVTQNTEPTVYERIDTPAKLQALRNAVNLGFDQAGKNFYLDADLDLGTGWTPIGTLTETNFVGANNTEKGIGFAGKFHGQNHKITFSQSNVFATGLFGVIMKDGTVEDLAVDGGTISNSGGERTNGNGTIASWCFGTIQNVVNFGVNIGSSSARTKGASGGIVGYLMSGGSIENAVNFGNVYCTENSIGLPNVHNGVAAGGIVGIAVDSDIQKVANYGGVSIVLNATEGGQAGGIAGLIRCKSGSTGIVTISHAYNYGAIDSHSSRGGIVGYSYNTVHKVSYAYNAGSVRTTDSAIYDSYGTSVVQTRNYTSKQTVVPSDWSTDDWAVDAKINGGGVYLKVLHELLINLGMVTVSAGATTNLDREWNGSNFKDSVIVTTGPTWVSTTVRNLYTSGSATNANLIPEIKSQTITKDGTIVTDIIDPGVYYVSATYVYGAHTFQPPIDVIFSLVKTTIATEADLIVLQKVVNLEGRDQKTKTFTMTNNITLTPNWTPIGQLTAENYSRANNTDSSIGFAGTFDGDGHRITNLTQSDVYTTGLFGVIKKGGTVMNLAIEGSTVNNSSGSTANGNGVIASWCFGTIENVVNFGVNVGENTETGRVTGASGGIVGYLCSGGTIKNAVNFGNVWFKDNYSGSCQMPATDAISRIGGGGIVGASANGTTISNVANYGNVSGYGSYGRAGGIVGVMYGGSISNAYNYGTMFSDADYAGGIVATGQGDAGKTLEYVYNAGTVTSSWAGNIVYTKTNFTINNSSETKPTELTGYWADTSKFGIDSGINAGGVYLIELHNMLVKTFKMVTGSATINGDNLGRLANGVNHVNGLKDVLVTDDSASWTVSDAVKTAYTQGGELDYKQLTITRNGEKVTAIVDAGTYELTVGYGYGSASFTEGDYITLYLYNVNTAIANLNDLKLFRDAVNGGIDFNGETFTLENSFSMGSEDWIPIGAVTAANYAKAKTGAVGFAGIFDGQKNVLTEFKQTSTGNIFVTGLFGVIKVGGTVRNLAIDGGVIRNTDGGGNGNGVIASWCFGHLENVVNFGVDIGTSTSGVYGSAGGIVGYLGSGATVTNAVNFGNIYTLSNHGSATSTDGLGLPNTDSGTYYNSRATSAGIVAITVNGTVSYAANYGDVTMTGSNAGAGGVVGGAYGGTIAYAYNYGKLTANQYAGGVVMGQEGSNKVTIRYAYQAGTIAESVAQKNPIAQKNNCTVENTCSTTKPTELTGAWSNTEIFGVDTAIHKGGVYLKKLHTLLKGFGLFDMGSVEAKNSGNLTESYSGDDYAVGLAATRFNADEPKWAFSDSVRAAYTGYANKDDVPYAKATIVKDGNPVTEIVDAGEYTVNAVYSFGEVLATANEFTFTVEQARGSWSKFSGEYTSKEQDVTFGFGMTLDNDPMIYSYTLNGETFNGRPIDAGTYILHVSVSGDLDPNNFDVVSGTEIEYVVTPKTINITWTDAVGGTVTTTYNGQAQTPKYTYDENAVYATDKNLVNFEYAYASNNASVGDGGMINCSDTVLKVKVTGDRGDNYVVADNFVTFSIKKRVLNVTWDGVTDGKAVYNFNGEYHLPTPVFTDADGDAELYTGVGEYALYLDESRIFYGGSHNEGWRNATTGKTFTLYVATGAGVNTSFSTNYELHAQTADAQGNPQVVLVIKPKTVTGTWSGATFEYNGKQQAPTFELGSDALCEPDVVSIWYDFFDADGSPRGAKPTSAGTYSVSVRLEGSNAGNYVLDEEIVNLPFKISNKLYKIEVTPMDEIRQNMGEVTKNTVGTGDWKVDRSLTKLVYPEAKVNLVSERAPLVLSYVTNGDESTRTVITGSAFAENGITTVNFMWRLPSSDDVLSVTFRFELPEEMKDNYDPEEGGVPAEQTILMKRTLTSTLSGVTWTYGDGEKDEASGYYMATTKGSLEYSTGWTVTSVEDPTVVPHYDFLRGTGDDANLEWMRLAIGKAGSTTIQLTHGESEKYLKTEIAVSVQYRPKNVQFNVRALRGSYGEKVYTTEDFLLVPTLAYDDTVASAFHLSSTYDKDTMKDVKRVDGEVVSYDVDVTIPANPNYTLNGQTGDLTLNASLMILPKALVIQAGTGYQAYYGYTSLPKINLTYEGFIDGEGFGENLTEPADFVPPTADFPKPETGKTFLDAKSYSFELTGGSARNYQFTLIGGWLTILKGSLAGVTGTTENLPYNATARTYAGTIDVSVIEGGTPIQEGYSYTVRRYFQNDDFVNPVNPVNAGTYSVEITVNTLPSDNYEDYTTILKNVFVIDKVTPNLNPIVSTGFVYNGEEQRGVSADWGIAGGSGTGKVTYTYFYQMKDGSEAETEHPIHAGTYHVVVAYVPGDNDNYDDQASTTVDFVIGQAKMGISFDSVNTSYDAKTHRIANFKVAGVGTHGSIFEADITDKVNYTITYRQGATTLENGVYPQNVGMYTVEIAAAPKSGAFTYDDYEDTFLRTESAVVITRVQIKEIKFEASKVDYDGSNKEPAKSAVAVGVEIGTDANGNPIYDEPQGTFRYDYRRIGDTIYVAYARSAGKYDVKVTYQPTANDNYTACDPAEFRGTEESPVFEISCAPITIRLNRADYNFTGEQFSVSAILNSTVAGEEPQGNVSYQYYYYDADGIKVNMGDTAPRNAGTYGVTVTYDPVINDNFMWNSESFDGYIVIRPIAPGISLVGAIHNFDGTAKGANEANLRGGAHDQVGPKQSSLIYMYKIGGNWTLDCPTEVGRYQVNVAYVPAEDEINYIKTDRTFNDGVIINNRRPTITLEPKTATYDGNPVRANVATIGDGTSAKGIVTYEYAQSTTWQTTVPVNVGTYSVRVIYRSVGDDNYASEVKEFSDYLVIQPAELVITPVDGQYKVYNGLPISGIEFNRPQLAPGNLWQGELYAPGIDEGEYEISMGTLTAGKNYTIKFTEGVKYRIEKRTVYFTFADVNPVYDGTYKQTTVSCEGVLEGEDPLCTVSYVGDRMNVGTFRAVASVAGKNYRASANNFREYEITPATMGEIPFANSTVRYDGQPHSILVTSAPDGSKVTYESAHTFTEIGAYVIRAKVTRPNYYDVDLRATLNIEKGTSRISVSVPGQNFRYGDALPQLIAVGDPGIATLDEGQVLLPGERDYTWTFLPLDSTHYETVTGTVQIRVIKASADVSLQGSLRQEENNTHELVTSTTEQLQGEVNVVYFDSNGTELKAAPTEAGNYTVRVSYAGDDYYEAFSYDRQLVITEKTSMRWLLYVVIGVVVLAVASGIFFNTKRKIK